jgi:hypothetical protein
MGRDPTRDHQPHTTGVGAFPLIAIWIIVTGIALRSRPESDARPVAAAALAS